MSKTIFLTGATGTMGWAGLQELLKRTDRFRVVVLARKSKKNIRKLQPLMDKIKVVWGDLTHYEDVLAGVTGADYVLHVGGMVSPAADYFPKQTMFVNVTAAKNVVKAILAQPNANEIKTVYIGSVAQTSNRPVPIHWGRTGDPLRTSVFDYYAVSKIRAERIFAESGLKHWVSLRQSGILYPEILKNFDPSMFHVPIHDVLEWTRQHYPCDSTRVYVLGMSLGGYGTMDFVGSYPDKVAAAMALCGGCSLRDVQPLGQVPLWIIHGTADRAVNVKESKKVVSALQDAHNDSRLRYDWWPGANHGKPARMFYLKKTYEWLFSHCLADPDRPVNRDIQIHMNELTHAYTDMMKNVPPPEVIENQE